MKSLFFLLTLMPLQLFAAVNMRVVCLFNDPMAGGGQELITIELAEDQDWDLPQPGGRTFPIIATRERHMLRITHYRNVRRRSGQSLQELSRAVTPEQIMANPILISGRMLGPTLTVSPLSRYWPSGGGDYMSTDRVRAQLTFMMPESGEDFPAQMGFARTSGGFVRSQLTCSRPHFYTVGEEISSDSQAPAATQAPATK